MSENEQTLDAEEKRAQLLIDSVPNGILGVDQSGLITLANGTATKLFGYEHAELMGQPVEVLLPKDGRKLFARRKDGSEFPVEIGLTPMESDGAAWTLYSIVDITDRKRAEQALIDNATRMAAVMNTVVDGLITIDEKGTIHSFNPGAERIFGYTAAEALGQNVKFLMPEPYYSAHDAHLRRYKDTGVKSIIGVGREVEAKRKDGSVFPMDLAVGEMLLHDRRLYVGILRDITARKDVETERLDLIAGLKQSNQELDDFAYIASHDLKEPLRGLFNNAQFLREDYEGLVDESGKKRFDRIFFLCKRMEKLIDDLLYFSRLGRQHLAYRKTDLNVVVHDILEQIESASGQSRVAFEVKELLPVLVCDETRIGEVFRNLITNAIKYNDKSEKLVEIGCLHEQAGQRHVLYVRDNGIGIPAQFQHDVFTIFKRLHPEDDKVRGSGVGLTFAKKIVERHGGHLWLESEPGQGTTFFFTLPEGIAK
jgi:PAS domain S-box-containing protein